jgi:hypothetical protein
LPVRVFGVPIWKSCVRGKSKFACVIVHPIYNGCCDLNVLSGALEKSRGFEQIIMRK